MRKTLIIPDCHHPAVDIAAWRLLLKVAKDLKPDVCVILGDFGDFASVMSHAKSYKQRQLLLIDEVADVKSALDDLDALPFTQKHFIAGNHEYRVDRYICEKCPELFGMVSISEVLELTKRGWYYTPYRDFKKVGNVYYTHDTGTAGINAHRTSLGKFRQNVVIGHTHRFGFEVKGDLGGRPSVGAMLGWLGDPKEAAGYMHSVNAKTDWAHGFGMAYEREDGVSYIHPIMILPDYSCVVEGKLFK